MPYPVPHCRTLVSCSRSHVIVYSLLLTLSLLLAGCGRGDGADNAQQGGAQAQRGERRGGERQGGDRQGGDRPVAVTTLRLQPEAFSEVITAVGTVKARESVTITAKVSELVQQVHFDSGDVVREGAALVTLSDRQQRAALSEAQAAADEAERLYQRQRELAAKQLIARAQLDNQRAARDTANARIAQIRAQLADRVIRAPFSGVLGLRQVSPGALITPGTPIATLDDLVRVYVDFPLPEAQLSRAIPGQGLTGSAAAWPGRSFSGNIATVDARIDPVTRAVLVRADLPNPERLLRAGMLVNINLPGVERQALRVPEIAVVQVGRESFVYRVNNDDSVEQIKVVVGARAEGKAELIEGVKIGDRIVIEGTGKLRPGAKISEGGEDKKVAGSRQPSKG